MEKPNRFCYLGRAVRPRAALRPIRPYSRVGCHRVGVQGSPVIFRNTKAWKVRREETRMLREGGGGSTARKAGPCDRGEDNQSAPDLVGGAIASHTYSLGREGISGHHRVQPRAKAWSS